MGKRGNGSAAGAGGEASGEKARQQAAAAKARESTTNRTKMSVGQSKTMRLKRGNQPRGGR